MPPGWLVEMEGIAIMPDRSRFAPFFLTKTLIYEKNIF